MKSQFHDIIPPEKRSIRNIPLNDSSYKDTQAVETPPQYIPHVEKEVKKIIPEERPPRKDPPYSYGSDPRKETLSFTGAKKVEGLPKLTLWLITIVSCLALFFVATYFFSEAEVKVATKKFTVTPPSSLNLSLTPTDAQVGYSVVTLSDTLSREVPATGEKEVTNSARGTLVVYNNFDSNAQKFVAGTRFETPQGLIYKAENAVTVPGRKAKDQPGSVEVVVIAEKPGATYNIGLTDFTIPGLKGDPRFNAFYARSKTTMTGGEAGKIAVVADDVLSKKVEELKAELDLKLKERLKKELPQNQLVLNDLLTIDYKIGSPILKDGKASIDVTGNAKGYVLDTTTLARVLLKSEDVVVAQTDKFVIDTENATTQFKLGTGSTTSTLSISGDVKVQYVFESEMFKEKIMGVNGEEVPEIAKTFPAISEITLVIKPFWIKKVPNDLDKITIIEE